MRIWKNENGQVLACISCAVVFLQFLSIITPRMSASRTFSGRIAARQTVHADPRHPDGSTMQLMFSRPIDNARGDPTFSPCIPRNYLISSGWATTHSELREMS